MTARPILISLAAFSPALLLGKLKMPHTLGMARDPMIVSGQPPMMAVAIGKTRYSLATFRHAQEFVIVMPSEHQEQETMLFGTKSGRDMDKLAVCGTKTEPATEIDCLLLSDAVLNLECVLESELETGDHAIFAGRVIAAHVNQDPNVRRLYTLDPNCGMGGVLPG